ncbi:Ribonuclease H-like domain containing protein [Trema orientale]|uniref:Ribonuclease H-like domain containing protein n=1 Tax=Trema orientale TaxID=63057 RepID=A0A2P5EN41_TREOI|nr:Ribonuclease H-like domain containing protein [Trema orientale]
MELRFVFSMTYGSQDQSYLGPSLEPLTLKYRFKILCSAPDLRITPFCLKRFLPMDVEAITTIPLSFGDRADRLGCWNLVNVGGELPIVDLLLHLFSSLPKDHMDVVCVLFWALWNRRNNFLHNGVVKEVTDTFDSKCLLLLEYRESSNKLTVSLPNLAPSSSSRWSSPRAGGLKFNTDATFLAREDFIGYGDVIHDEFGNVLVCWIIWVTGCFYVEVGELIAIREGLRLAVNFGCPLAETESDSLLAVNSISNSQQNKVLLFCCRKNSTPHTGTLLRWRSLRSAPGRAATNLHDGLAEISSNLIVLLHVLWL